MERGVISLRMEENGKWSSQTWGYGKEKFWAHKCGQVKSKG